MANIALKDLQFPGLNNVYKIPEVDNTLTISGAAADAKKTGDELSDLKQDYNLIEDSILHGTDLSVLNMATLLNGKVWTHPSTKIVLDDWADVRVCTDEPMTFGDAVANVKTINGYNVRIITVDSDKETYISETSWLSGEFSYVFNADKYYCFNFAVTGGSSLSDVTVKQNVQFGLVTPVSKLIKLSQDEGTVHWEQGTYNTQGVPTDSTARIRMPYAIGLAQGYTEISCDEGYEFGIQAIDGSGNYIGLLQTNGTWAKSSDAMAIVTHFSMFDYDSTYSYRLIGKLTNNSQILPSAGTHFIFSVYPSTDIERKNTSVHNVRFYGAKGDGTTDDSKAIQSAFNDCSSSGGTVFIPSGTYVLKTPLVVYSNTTVKLDSGATLLRGDNVRSLIHSFCEVDTTEYDGVKNVTIEGGTLDCNTGFIEGSACVAFIHAENIIIRNVTFKHFSKGFHACDISGCKNVLIENCIFTDIITDENTGCCIQVDCPWGRVTYTYDGFEEGSACFDSTPCLQFVVRGCTFYLNNYSPAFGNHNDGLNRYIVFEGNCVYGGKSTRGAIAFADYKDHNYTDVILIHNNVFSGCDYGFKFMNDGTGKAYIRNNVFEDIGTLQVNPNSPVGQFEDNITITTD